MEVIIVTGLSGAGKSQAAHCLEDLGYYCIDNMPPALIKNFIELSLQDRMQIEKAAFVVDARGGDFFDDLQDTLQDLRNAGLPFKILFLEASDTVLIRRY
ncbi:MAG: RNase adaptor protein RapZ, partial [Firmicutes bacterium]|nr:RNase adaptor protein RapZ [Bacillota bacterium]